MPAKETAESLVDRPVVQVFILQTDQIRSPVQNGLQDLLLPPDILLGLLQIADMIFQTVGHDIKSLGQGLDFIAAVFQVNFAEPAVLVFRGGAVFLTLVVAGAGEVPAAMQTVAEGRAILPAAVMDFPAVLLRRRDDHEV